MIPNLLMVTRSRSLQFLAETVNSADSGSMSLSIPAGIQVGDLTVLVAGSKNVMPSLVAGWTNIATFSNGTTVSSSNVRIQARIRQSGDANSVSVLGSHMNGIGFAFAFRPLGGAFSPISVGGAVSGGQLPAILGPALRFYANYKATTGLPSISDAAKFETQRSRAQGNSNLVASFSILNGGDSSYTVGNAQLYRAFQI